MKVTAFILLIVLESIAGLVFGAYLFVRLVAR